MIQNIFFPEKIGSYYLFKKRIVGIDIGKTHINATFVQTKGSTITIKNFYQVPIEASATQSHDEQTVEALKNLIAQLPKYDEIHTTLSSSLVVFKELKLPFTQPEKIGLVIKFEIEPLLPFSINDAVIDFIITRPIPEEKSSQVLVACVQKQYIAQHLALFEQAGIEPDVITVDFFALYGLYKAIPSYANQEGGVVLVDLGFNSTRLAYIQDGQLRLIRVLPHGISSITKQVGTSLSISAPEAYEKIVRFGLLSDDETANSEVIATSFKDFLEKIRFTIASFATQTNQDAIQKVILIGNIAQTKGFTELASKILQVSTSVFDPHLISEIPHIALDNNHINLTNILSTATALVWDITKDFNLRREEFSIKNTSLLLKQLIVMATLILLIFASLITQYIIQTAKLNKEMRASETEVVTTLKEQFPKIPQDENDLDDIIEMARQEVENEKEIWFAFSYANQARYLHYLLELSNKIDKKSLGFEISKITITEGSIILKAQVKDYEALKILERELRSSSLFSFVEPQDNPSFTMNITVAPTIEEI